MTDNKLLPQQDTDSRITELTQRLQELQKLHDLSNQRIAQLEEENQRIAQLEEENQRLRDLLDAKAKAKDAKKPRFQQNYSLDKNIDTKPKKKKHKSTGRRPGDSKKDKVTRHQDVYPDGLDRPNCQHQRIQYAWRIENGQAVYVAYHIYNVPGSKQSPLPPGLRNSRSEFGIEIILILAFLHYWIGISIDHACEVLEFFTHLPLSKSQADSLLSQLANDWNDSYDAICQLIALQMIVYIDETGWKVGSRSCYTWVFSTALHVLFRCGVGRGKEEAEKVLGEDFEGIGVSDDYAAYKNLFTTHQLCWAHLLRKAIKLALQHPDNTEYGDFLDQLCRLYDQAKKYQTDQRLSSGRPEKVRQLQEQLDRLCARAGEVIDEQTPTDLAVLIRLQNELTENSEKLFVFVEHPEVEPTNNRSERNVRKESETRKGGRTSKTAGGAKRRSIIMTVLGSLQTRLEKFTLGHLLEEVFRWVPSGRSLFTNELEELQQVRGSPEPMPQPSG